MRSNTPSSVNFPVAGSRCAWSQRSIAQTFGSSGRISFDMRDLLSPERGGQILRVRGGVRDPTLARGARAPRDGSGSGVEARERVATEPARMGRGTPLAATL